MPDRFGSIADARTFFGDLFTWHNERHYHSGIALLTPADDHQQLRYAAVSNSLTRTVPIAQSTSPGHSSPLRRAVVRLFTREP